MNSVCFELTEMGSLLAHVQAQSSLTKRVKETQGKNSKLTKIKSNVKKGKERQMVFM